MDTNRRFTEDECERAREGIITALKTGRQMPSDVLEHVDQCVDCTNLAKSYALASLTASRDCPEGAVLSDFVLGDLDPLEALSIASHVVSCRTCFAIVGTMKECMAAVVPSVIRLPESEFVAAWKNAVVVGRELTEAATRVLRSASGALLALWTEVRYQTPESCFGVGGRHPVLARNAVTATYADGDAGPPDAGSISQPVLDSRGKDTGISAVETKIPHTTTAGRFLAAFALDAVPAPELSVWLVLRAGAQPLFLGPASVSEGVGGACEVTIDCEWRGGITAMVPFRSYWLVVR